jgi:hypothetical protein
MITDGSTFAVTITDLLTDGAGGFLAGRAVGLLGHGELRSHPEPWPYRDVRRKGRGSQREARAGSPTHQAGTGHSGTIPHCRQKKTKRPPTEAAPRGEESPKDGHHFCQQCLCHWAPSERSEFSFLFWSGNQDQHLGPPRPSNPQDRGSKREACLGNPTHESNAGHSGAFRCLTTRRIRLPCS